MNKFFKKFLQITADLISQPHYKITLIYAIVGILWIFFSDSLLTLITKDPAVITKISMAKGWAFIIITACLLYALIRNNNARTKKTFDALSESETKYRELFENANEAIMLIELGTESVPTKFLEVNETACRWIGLTRKELLSMPADDLAVTALNKDIDTFKKEVLIENKRQFEAVLTRKDGSTFNLEFYINIIEFKGKRVLLITAREYH